MRHSTQLDNRSPRRFSPVRSALYLERETGMFAKFFTRRGQSASYTKQQLLRDKLLMLAVIACWWIAFSYIWLVLMGRIPSVRYRPSGLYASAEGQPSAPTQMAVRRHPTAVQFTASVPALAPAAWSAIDPPMAR